MQKNRVIFILLLFAAATITLPTRSAVAQYGHWQNRWQSHFARHYAPFRQESPWRRWEQARHTSRQPIQSTHGCPTCYEAPYQPSSIGAYNPGNTPAMRVMNGSSSRPSGAPSQGVGSSYQSAGSSSRNTDSSSTGGYQTSQTRYTCIVADMGYCSFSGRANISSGSICHCGEASGFTR